jgi:hypothetical protein
MGRGLVWCLQPCASFPEAGPPGEGVVWMPNSRHFGKRTCGCGRFSEGNEILQLQRFPSIVTRPPLHKASVSMFGNRS